MTDRLSLAVLDQVPPGVRRPSHTARSQAGPGIVHLGVGAFHRAHQAIYTDDALAAEGGDWRITGVSLRGTDIADALNPQDGLYTVLVPGSDGSSEARIIGSIAQVIAARRQPDSVLAALVAPATRIVSLTVTEKAYGIDRSSGQVLPDHPNIAPDLLAPMAPSGPVGLIVEALRRRRAAGSPAFTVLCCDNLPENGSLLRGGVLDFAARVDPGLRDWIATAVAFPSTMVDRITPSVTDATLSLAERVTGLIDLAAIETEPFTQWVIEDRFSAGRPAWDAGGALFVDDVCALRDHEAADAERQPFAHRLYRIRRWTPLRARRHGATDVRAAGGTPSRRRSVDARAAARDRPSAPTRRICRRASAIQPSRTKPTRSQWTGPRSCRSEFWHRPPRCWPAAGTFDRLPSPWPLGRGTHTGARTPAKSTSCAIHARTPSRRHSGGRAPRRRQRLPNCRRYQVSFQPVCARARSGAVPSQRSWTSCSSGEWQRPWAPS